MRKNVAVGCFPKMKKTVSMIAVLILIVQIVCAPSIAAQTKTPLSTGVTMTNAYDAFGKEIKGAEHDFGFSAVIEYKGKRILFDAGTNAKIFESNLKALKIDLRTIDVAVVSHGHYDHIGGFDYLTSVNPKVKIYAPNDFNAIGAPTVFPFREAEPSAAETLSPDERYFRGTRVVEGMMTTPTGKFWKSDVEYPIAAKEILPGVTVIPTVAKMMGTFIKYPPFEENPQLNGMPELSLALATDKGEIIISGCSHTTIESIVQETKKVRKGKIYLVAGGFHLIPYKRADIETLAKKMRDEYGVEAVAPAHCTGHLGFSIFKKEFGANYKFFGLGEKLNL